MEELRQLHQNIRTLMGVAYEVRRSDWPPSVRKGKSYVSSGIHCRNQRALKELERVTGALRHINSQVEKFLEGCN